MSNLIPIRIAELAVQKLNEENEELRQEIARIKAEGHTLSLAIHRSKSYGEFYPQLGEFERRIGIQPRGETDLDVRKP